MDDKMIKKLGIKPDQKIISINAPVEYTAVIEAAGLKAAKQLRGRFDHIHFFAEQKPDIDKSKGIGSTVRPGPVGRRGLGEARLPRNVVYRPVGAGAADKAALQRVKVPPCQLPVSGM